MKRQMVDILLVEDREEDAEMAMIALHDHRLSNRIKWVKDGQEALDYLYGMGEYKDVDTTTRPKVVLLDLKMPKVDGLEVLRQIRSADKTKTMPVVVLTTSKEDKDVETAYELGANSYIVKPVDFDQFTKSIREIGMYWVVVNQPPRTN